MRNARVLLTLLTTVALAGTAAAQMSTGRDTKPATIDLVQIEEELEVLNGTLRSLESDLSSLERALGQPANVLWLAEDGSGWRAAPRVELVEKIRYLRFAADHAERRNQTDPSGLGLPASLVALVESRPNRPAGRILREWTESNAADTQKAVAGYRQNVGRNIRNVQSWIAENEKIRQQEMKPVSESVLSQGGCYIPSGRWAIDSSNEVLEVSSVGQTILAKKTKGSSNIPAGKISFYVNATSCFGGMQMADPGYENAEWLRDRVQVNWLNDDQFRIVWPQRGAVVYNRAR